ncbi:MAG: hypothetical protein FJ267_12845, partial [Planctomycetes bacterium]|nr:hypothetical protein [Planctomycetota bacterium]
MMFDVATVLFERSLRVDARSLGPHLARSFLMVSIYFAVIFSYSTAAFLGAPGLRFFLNIVYIDLIFMTLLGFSFFSTSITEEKEEDTLGLLLMAGVSSLGLLLGKSGGRLVQAAILIAVQYPFTLLAITFGGITQHQIRATYIAMFSYLVFLSGAGLLCSTISKNNRVASVRLFVIVIGYWLIPISCRQALIDFPGMPRAIARIMTSISQSCVFLQIGSTMTTGFNESVWSTQVINNLLFGIACYPLSWRLFSFASRVPSTEATSRGLVTKDARFFRWMNAGRPWRSPLVWKDFNFIAGGISAVIIRFAMYFTLYFASMAVISLMIGPIPGQLDKTQTGSFLFLTVLAMSIDAGLLISRSLHEEIRGKTWTSLVLLPTSTIKILISKLMACLLCWCPGPISLLLGIGILPYGHEIVGDVITYEPEIWFWLFANMILVPHAAAVFATFVRWGALPLGICCGIASFFMTMALIIASQIATRGSSERAI